MGRARMNCLVFRMFVTYPYTSICVICVCTYSHTYTRACTKSWDPRMHADTKTHDRVIRVWFGRAHNRAKKFSRSLTFELYIIFSSTPYLEQENRIAFVFAGQLERKRLQYGIHPINQSRMYVCMYMYIRTYIYTQKVTKSLYVQTHNMTIILWCSS